MTSPASTAAVVLGLAGIATLTWSNLELRNCVTDMSQRIQTLEAQSKSVFGEVTRIRIEQRSDKKGPDALLEKLRTYAPLAASSRTAQPDFTMATEEMEATLRAFSAIGRDAYPAIAARFRSLDPNKDYDEMKQLMRAAVRSDPDAGAKLVVSIVQGGTDVKPSPRLRFAAAELLLTIDQALAQSLLRRIVLAESWRGRDPERAAAHELPALATQSIASSGFSTFIIHYMRSQDPGTEDTLLQILNRSDNDVPSVQEMIEWLGEHRSARADQRIEELYHKPPGAADNAIFLNKCLDALDNIRGPAARPFFEAEMAKASNKLVLDHLQWLLNKK